MLIRRRSTVGGDYYRVVFNRIPTGSATPPAAGEAGAGTGMTQSGPNDSFGVSRQKVRDASPRAMSVLVIVVADFRGILPRPGVPDRGERCTCMSNLGATVMSQTVPIGAKPKNTGGRMMLADVSSRTNRCHPQPSLGVVVQRTALLARLLAADSSPIVMMHAPAGYGKTTVLSQWAEVDTRPFAWLTLDDSHNDPALLVRDIAAATAPVRLPLVNRLRLLPDDDFECPSAFPFPVRELVGQVTTPFVLVLDDCHRVTRPASLGVIDHLMASMPPGSQIALASRTVDPNRAGRFRTEHHLLEITAKELAFDAEEARTVLGPLFAPNAARRAYERSEGWPAGVRMSALSVPGATVMDYLHSEFLSGLDEPTMTLLTRTSILAELSGAACDAVCGPGSGPALQRLLTNNLLIVPLDGGQRYRYHHLLRWALRAELQSREGSLVPVLHERASRWFAAHGRVDAAIRHAKLSGDMAGTGKLVWANLDPAGGIDGLRCWLADLTDEQIGQSQDLVVASAWLSLMSGDLHTTMSWLSFARARDTNSPVEFDGSDRRCTLALLHAWSGSGGDMCERSSGAFRALPVDSRWRSLAAVWSGIALALSGRLSEAQDRLRAGEVLARGLGHHAARVDGLAALAWLAFARGNQTESDELITLAEAVITDHDLVKLPTSAYCLSVVAGGLARIGRTAEAARMVDRANGLTVITDFAPWLQIHTRTLQANTYLMVGNVVTARRLTRQARTLLEQRALDPNIAAVLNAAVTHTESLLAQVSPKGSWELLPFTLAELRVLHLLSTYLSFPEMAALLFLSRHTVKSQALSIYRRLGATSRHEAVERACSLGYLPPMAMPAPLSAPQQRRLRGISNSSVG